MDDRIEVYGEGGVTYADLHMGNALPTFSEHGYGYAVEKAPTTKGWSYPVFGELWNYGFPQEMQHFVNSVLGKEICMETGEDGVPVIVHRKGATRAFGPGMPGLPDRYCKTGQPVIIGGSMETGSYLLVGVESGAETFFTTAHGSGRAMGRHEAKRRFKGRELEQQMRERGIVADYLRHPQQPENRLIDGKDFKVYVEWLLARGLAAKEVSAREAVAA